MAVERCLAVGFAARPFRNRSGSGTEDVMQVATICT